MKLFKNVIILFSILIINGCANFSDFLPSSSSTSTTSVQTGDLNVGLILPLTGEHAELGKNMLDASNLALSELENKKVQLTPIDSTSRNISLNDLQQRLQNNKFDLIIGPIMAHQAQSAYSLFHARNIPMITFSNDTALLNHPGLYSIGMMPEQQIERVLNYAATAQYDHVIALLPANRYGDLISNMLVRKKLSSKYQVLEVIKYQSNAKHEDMDQTIASVQQAITKHQAVLANKKFALLIPEGGNFIKGFAEKFAATAATHNGGIKYLGSSQWDDQQLITIPALEGAWIASVPHQNINAFEDRFYKKFAYKPVKISALAYDAMAISVVLARSQRSPQEILNHHQGFRGLSGEFKFKDDGSNERSLAIYEINNKEFKLIDNAR